MGVSREYALIRLDRWYADQIRRNYTPEIARELKTRVLERLAGTEEGDFLRNASGDMDPFSPELLAEFMGKFFSSAWEGFELGHEGRELDALALPEGFRIEYEEPFLEACRTLRALVDSVRSRANEAFPDELSDAQVRESLFAPVNGLEGYCKFSRNALEAIGGAMQAHMTRGVSYDEGPNYRVVNAFIDFVEEFNRQVLRE